MRWTQRLAATATAVLLLSVPAMALVLTASPMSEPQGNELLAATAAAATVRNDAVAAGADRAGTAETSPITLTEWRFTGDSCCSPTYPKGDMNFDGVVNGLDVDLFVSVVVRGSNQIAMLSAADTNGDCVVNGLDVDPFLALLLTPSP